MKEKYSDYLKQPVSNSQNAKVWRAGLYIRLSREDEDMKGVESNSITSQREFLKEYIKQKPDIEPVDFYVDDGFSGTNFERPNFMRMMNDVYAGKINCVIVKDLSRLGRNASETGKYIDDIFARLQVRFIAVHNYIDTVENKMNAATHCITVGIQNVINESVAATTSVNVRGTLNVERQQGKFIGSFASYGYKKDPDDHHKLIIDDEAAQVVRNIYSLFIGGKSIIGIVKELNSAHIPNPSAYKQIKGLNYNRANSMSDGLWCSRTVRRILSNEVYIGNMVQGKNTTISFKHKKCRSVPQEQWYRVENTHEPIIDDDTFEKAQSLFNKNIRKSPKKNDVDLFSGFVRCSDCHRIMTKKTNKHSYGTYEYYRCTTDTKMKDGSCGNHTIRIDKLEKAVTVTINQLISIATEMSEIIENINSRPKRNYEMGSLKSALESAIREKEKIKNISLDLYPDWKSGVISKEEYTSLKTRLEEKLKITEDNISSIKKTMEEYENGLSVENEFIANFKKYGTVEKLTRPILIELVDEILVHQGGKIEINFKYKDSFAEAMEYIEINEEEKEEVKTA